MKTDSAGLQVLTHEECLALLASVPVGRIVFTDRALPAVQPVNFVLDRGTVVIRTAAASRLASAVRNTVVAFEVDQFDARMRAGWSVTMVGHAHVVLDGHEIERLALLPLTPWVPEGKDQFIVLRPENIAGRRIAP
ncbi:pyridoxamine 5'-phosphate oxidase family protein [Sphaerisporangium dianthi]|uniref:Pyridoxamine 5'-phosphate oxidase family protein n=1 Tax=Sphaerisporangium dianthi TaxID=1436120 RepID=A0ABV9CQL3_9ACTN